VVFISLQGFLVFDIQHGPHSGHFLFWHANEVDYINLAKYKRSIMYQNKLQP